MIDKKRTVILGAFILLAFAAPGDVVAQERTHEGEGDGVWLLPGEKGPSFYLGPEDAAKELDEEASSAPAPIDEYISGANAAGNVEAVGKCTLFCAQCVAYCTLGWVIWGGGDFAGAKCGPAEDHQGCVCECIWV